MGHKCGMKVAWRQMRTFHFPACLRPVRLATLHVATMVKLHHQDMPRLVGLRIVKLKDPQELKDKLKKAEVTLSLPLVCTSYVQAFACGCGFMLASFFKTALWSVETNPATWVTSQAEAASSKREDGYASGSLGISTRLVMGWSKWRSNNKGTGGHGTCKGAEGDGPFRFQKMKTLTSSIALETLDLQDCQEASGWN